jgi:exodeoxyribonuclease-3
VRALHPDQKIYTFWKYWRHDFERDAGLRIDHLLLSPTLATRLVAAGVDRFARAMERTSDHAPTWVELDD